MSRASSSVPGETVHLPSVSTTRHDPPLIRGAGTAGTAEPGGRGLTPQSWPSPRFGDRYPAHGARSAPRTETRDANVVVARGTANRQGLVLRKNGEECSSPPERCKAANGTLPPPGARRGTAEKEGAPTKHTFLEVQTGGGRVPDASSRRRRLGALAPAGRAFSRRIKAFRLISQKRPEQGKHFVTARLPVPPVPYPAGTPRAPPSVRIGPTSSQRRKQHTADGRWRHHARDEVTKCGETPRSPSPRSSDRRSGTDGSAPSDTLRFSRRFASAGYVRRLEEAGRASGPGLLRVSAATPRSRTEPNVRTSKLQARVHDGGCPVG